MQMPIMAKGVFIARFIAAPRPSVKSGDEAGMNGGFGNR
jgi:hypothetical protein